MINCLLFRKCSQFYWRLIFCFRVMVKILTILREDILNLNPCLYNLQVQWVQCFWVLRLILWLTIILLARKAFKISPKYLQNTILLLYLFDCSNSQDNFLSLGNPPYIIPNAQNWETQISGKGRSGGVQVQSGSQSTPEPHSTLQISVTEHCKIFTQVNTTQPLIKWNSKSNRR